MESKLLGTVTRRPISPSAQHVIGALLHWSSVALVGTVWVSTMLFGLYILAFYAGALAEGEMARWNEVLPRLYERDTTASTAGIALHFAAGGIILNFLVFFESKKALSC